MEYTHKPVLLNEFLENVPKKVGPAQSKVEGVFVDGTLGGGSHTKALLLQLKVKSKKLKVVGIDRDLEAIFAAKKNLLDFEKQITFIHDNYTAMPIILKNLKIKKVDLIFLDLGVSSYQFDNPERGFSFQNNAPLDMRMDQSQKITAGEIVNYYKENELSGIFFKFGEERFSRQIARKIVEKRKEKPIKTTKELVEIIKSATPPKNRFSQKIHFATRVFQALRIEVNDELKNLEGFIPKAIEFLNPGGRLIIISFHSLEDRIVKHTFRKLAEDYPENYKVLTKKPIIACAEEVRENPRSRSAKMRVLEKIE
ncbi:MAG: S-adenosyl-methyltransferase MraW [Candidatus Berkelbacteria bacterium Athens1014_28]|uniref:Ribosomal RNA small subunit methyltransferase H n=1 Tax=Candidatus Berkelbacteria bacterium Athens1014_28 TaxID=2017145 RepID=A0A554LK39_9BACT|nr:MAG: S-adenosyl-methyltransferase MraW [Candidatus Berkelbacteria bacterium Athens1014_28]